MVERTDPWHRRSEVVVAANPPTLFAHLDDHRRMAGHMEKASLMMAGATMRVTLDALGGRAVGSLIRLDGRGLGLSLQVEEVVTEREPPVRKTWETRGRPQLLVICDYRMGFTITPLDSDHAHLEVSIDYALPPHPPARWLGRLFGCAYAVWCTRRMAGDTAAGCPRGRGADRSCPVSTRITRHRA